MASEPWKDLNIQLNKKSVLFWVISPKLPSNVVVVISIFSAEAGMQPYGGPNYPVMKIIKPDLDGNLDIY